MGHFRYTHVGEGRPTFLCFRKGISRHSKPSHHFFWRQGKGPPSIQTTLRAVASHSVVQWHPFSQFLLGFGGPTKHGLPQRVFFFFSRVTEHLRPEPGLLKLSQRRLSLVSRTRPPSPSASQTPSPRSDSDVPPGLPRPPLGGREGRRDQVWPSGPSGGGLFPEGIIWLGGSQRNKLKQRVCRGLTCVC